MATTKEVAKQSDTQEPQATPEDIMAKAKAAKDPRDVIVAATELAMFRPQDLTEDAVAFVTDHASDVLALVNTSEAHEDTTRNAYAEAQRIADASRAVMCVYAYGVTKVSGLMTQVELAQQWATLQEDGTEKPMSKQDIGSYVTAGQAAVKAGLGQQQAAITVALQRAKRHGNAGMDALGVKGKVDRTAFQQAITKAATAKEVKDEDSLKRYVQGYVRKQSKPRGPGKDTKTQQGQTFDANDLGVTVPREAHALAKRITALGKADTTLAGKGVITADPNMTGRDALVMLHTKLGEYLKATHPKPKEGHRITK